MIRFMIVTLLSANSAGIMAWRVRTRIAGSPWANPTDGLRGGHSLGGAMATILAGRCELSDIAAVPVEVVTFGSPRVGTKRYVQNAKIKHIRWVNNNDIVTRVPPTWLRYRHTGTRMYLDRNGDVRRLTRQQRTKDRWVGFKEGIKNRRFDHFSDHAIANYVAYLVKANEPERR
jgi:triacylglycerol lipase